MKKLFEGGLSTTNAARIDSAEEANRTQLASGENAATVERSVQFGKKVATAIAAYAAIDGGDKAYLDPFQLPYNLPVDSFCWVPTSATTKPLCPKWGQNRPFQLINVTITQPVAPLPFSSLPGSAFYREAMVVYNQVKNNTHDQLEVVKFWADDPFSTCTPTGHTFNILTQLLEENRCTLAKSALAYAKLSIAENDAFIACWQGKYRWLLLRPITFIRRYIDPGFNTVIGTPPFPTYTSGHSCEMGAGSRVFTSLFTDGSGNYPFTDYSQLRFGFPPRNFSNFNQLADECADSRLYGGIHFPMDNIKCLQVGPAIGDNVNSRLNWPVNVQ